MSGVDSQPEGMISVDKSKVDRTFRKLGMVDFLKRDLSDEEVAISKKKGYTPFQWKLIKGFHKMLDDELYLLRLEHDFSDKNVHTSGYTLRQLMNRYPNIAETVFEEWAMRIGINHLYARSLGEDLTELKGRVIKNGSCCSVYKRFTEIVHRLTP